MNKLIQDNWARTYGTASTGGRRFPSEFPLTDNPRASRTLSLAPLVTAGYSPDTKFIQGVFPSSFFTIRFNIAAEYVWKYAGPFIMFSSDKSLYCGRLSETWRVGSLDSTLLGRIMLADFKKRVTRKKFGKMT